MKKLMLLGGSRYLKPVIDAAHKLGLYVITCDFLPENDVHKLSDEYCNISIIEKDAVLEAALKLKINGIMSFACDPGVVTAAYVAEKMGLPFQGSYESTCILQDKGLFRQFLLDNNFNCPHARRYTDKKAPFNDIDYFTWPVIVKPVDSAGSKGVNRVDSPDKLSEAIDVAVDGSHNGAFIIEDFLTFEGYHSDADPFTVDGKLEFVSYSDQLFDKDADNPYTPAYIIWPSSMKQEHQDYLTGEIQRLMQLLNMKTGIYNIESCVGNNGKPYIMEVSPRGGGCKIAELQKMAYGIDLIENEVRKAVGMSVINLKQTECVGHWAEMIVHARPNESGILESVSVDPEIADKYLKVVDLSAKEGDIVKPFTGANMALGDMFFRFDSRDKLNEVMSKSQEWLHINLK
ncbi:MAG: ATP-grasp domain-containing protein [Butyrivibrio sp.]|nr:ATP-grasp domain-containing protein [Butyrivibrio sp.]